MHPVCFTLRLPQGSRVQVRIHTAPFWAVCRLSPCCSALMPVDEISAVCDACRKAYLEAEDEVWWHASTGTALAAFLETALTKAGGYDVLTSVLLAEALAQRMEWLTASVWATWLPGRDALFMSSMAGAEGAYAAIAEQASGPLAQALTPPHWRP